MFLRLPLGMLAAIFTSVPSNKENIKLTEERIAALNTARQAVVGKLEDGDTKDLHEELDRLKRELAEARQDLATFRRLEDARN